MCLDPDEYNPDEPRHITRDAPRARQNSDDRFDDGRFNDGRFNDHGPPRFDNPLFDRNRQEASEALQSSQLEHLFARQSHSEEDSVEKPYFHSLPGKCGAGRVVFDQLEFLILKNKFKRAMDTLRHYQTVNQVTSDVEEMLQDYLLGFSTDIDGSTDLDVDDHLLSLVCVARLSSTA